MKTNIKRFSSIMLAVIFILTAVVPMMGFTIVEVNPGLRPDPELGILDPGLEIGVGDAISTGIILICPEQGEIEMPSARVEFVPEEGFVVTDRQHGRFALEYGQGFRFAQLEMGEQFVEQAREVAIAHAIENGLPLRSETQSLFPPWEQHIPPNFGPFWVYLNTRLVPQGVTTHVFQNQMLFVEGETTNGTGAFLRVRVHRNAAPAAVLLDEIFIWGTAMTGSSFGVRLTHPGNHSVIIDAIWTDSFSPSARATRAVNVTARQHRIVINAGHGGSASGATGHGHTESHDNLAMALAVENILRNEFGQTNIIQTRSDDSNPSVATRVNLANSNNTAVYVSIHRDHSGDQSVNGVWTFVTPGIAANSIDRRIAQNVQNRMVGVGSGPILGVNASTVNLNRMVDRGVRDFVVYFGLRDVRVPAILIELGFISNANDNRLFQNHRNDYARAIALGIIESLN